MEHVHENVHGPRYYWKYVKRFGKESSETWRKDFMIAFALAVIPILLAWGDRTVLQGALLAVEAIGLLYGIVALRHLVHTSLILFRERAHPEHGGIRHTHWGYGVWGASILLALVAGITCGWLRKPLPVALHVPAPIPPTITSPNLVSPPQSNATRETKILKPSVQTGTRQTLTPNTASQTPSQTPPQVAQSPPATFLERVVQENRGLTPDDRNRLSTELYECDQFIKQSQGVGYKLNVEFGKLGNDRQSGALAKNVDEHIKLLRDLDTPAWDQYHGLQHLQDKWRYLGTSSQMLRGRISTSPPIKNLKHRFSFFDANTAARIINATVQPYKLMCLIAALCGLRIGEVTALKVTSLDFERKRIVITGALDYATRKETTPKSEKSAAPVHMPDLLARRLRNWLDKHYKPNVEGYLFTNSKGRAYLSDNVVRYGVHRAMAKLGIETPKGVHICIHCFRHGVTTELLESGTPIHVLTRMMRHADSKVTLDHYAHIVGDAERTASERFSAKLGVQLESDPELESNSAAKSA